jgi:hypothetical protein
MPSWVAAMVIAAVLRKKAAAIRIDFIRHCSLSHSVQIDVAEE